MSSLDPQLIRFILALIALGAILGGLVVWVVMRQPVALGVVSMGIYPDKTLTPGMINPAVTQNNIQQTICVAGWTKTIRPASSYTTALKIKQIKQYGYKDTKTASYEEDHLISLELGGHPSNPSNLWPESYNTVPNARDKDKVENYLHKEVCANRITLAVSQKEITTDWVKVYLSLPKNVLGAAIVGVDEDDE